jgi:SAM-dependent methyltransferase
VASLDGTRQSRFEHGPGKIIVKSGQIPRDLTAFYHGCAGSIAARLPLLVKANPSSDRRFVAINNQDNGWEHIASAFAADRSDTGRDVIRRWSSALPSGGEVLDVGCGSGFPVSSTLVEQGLTVFGIDASPTLVSMFARQFGDARAACEAVQDSTFFGRTFGGVLAIGLMFLLSEDDQRKLINKVAEALGPGGRFLLTAPHQKCEWEDVLTGQRSVSLGKAQYERLLDEAGMQLNNTCMDEGDNHYFDAVRRSAETD